MNPDRDCKDDRRFSNLECIGRVTLQKSDRPETSLIFVAAKRFSPVWALINHNVKIFIKRVSVNKVSRTRVLARLHKGYSLVV